MTQDFFSAVRVSKFSSSSASFLPVKAPPRPSSFPLSPAPASQEARASKHPLFLRSSSCEISRWKFTRRRDSPATALALAARVGGNQAIRWRSRQWDEGRCGATRSGAAPQISDIANKTGFSKRGTTGYTCNSLGFSNTGVACGFTTLSAIDKPAPPHENGPQPPHKGKKSPPQHPSNYISHGLN